MADINAIYYAGVDRVKKLYDLHVRTSARLGIKESLTTSSDGRVPYSILHWLYSPVDYAFKYKIGDIVEFDEKTCLVKDYAYNYHVAEGVYAETYVAQRDVVCYQQLVIQMPGSSSTKTVHATEVKPAAIPNDLFQLARETVIDDIRSGRIDIGREVKD